MEIIENIWNSPSRYIVIGIVIFTILYIPAMFMYANKKKKEAKQYHNDNPNLAKVRLKSGVSSAITVISVNGEVPNYTYEGAHQGFFILPGDNVIEAQYTWTRPGIMARSVTKTIGPTKIKVTAAPSRNYLLSFDKSIEEYIFEETE